MFLCVCARVSVRVCLHIYIYIYIYILTETPIHIFIYFRLHQETKHLSKTYASLESNQKAYYRPVNFDVTQPEMNFDFSTLNTQEKNQSGRFNVSEGQNAPRFDQCTCATLPARACNSDERETIYNSIKST